MSSKSSSHPADIDEFSLRSLLDNASEAVSRFDRQLRHVYANQATARANNRPAEDFYGKTMRDLGHSEEISQLIETNVRAVFDSGEEKTFDVTFEGPWGTRYFQTRMTPERDERGTTHHVIVISRDLTKERTAEQKVLEAERFAAASRLAHELAHQLNNPLQALRNTIYLLQSVPNDGLSVQRLELANTLLHRVETIVQAILQLRVSDLESHDLNNTVERVRETFEASQRLLAIAESAQFAMVAIDMDGVITTWNRAACRIYGWSANEALGRRINDLSAKGQEQMTAEVLEKIKAGESIVPFEGERTTKDGRKIRMRFYVSPVQGPDGELLGVSSIGVELK